jgi:putative glutamine amidotransferase
VAAAREAAVPVLAICRGVQVLNVAFGGTLVQHLVPAPGDPAGEGHDNLARAGDEVHEVVVLAGSRLQSVVGADRIGANTLHHQAVDVVGAGLVVSAVAGDGVIEAIEAPGEPVLGVQWHPELLVDRPHHRALFEWVVAAAAGVALSSHR